MRNVFGIIAALFLTACEPPPNDEATPADGGVAVIQQAATCGGPQQPPCLYTWNLRVHVTWRFHYHPIADVDIASPPSGWVKELPRVYPQTTTNGTTWYGQQPSINSISPISSFFIAMANCPADGTACSLFESGPSWQSTFTTAVAGPFSAQGLSAVTMTYDSAVHRVQAGWLWASWSPMCKQSGRPNSGESTENTYIALTPGQSDLYFTITERGSPYYEPQYWERVEAACQVGHGVRDRGYQAWHHQYWYLSCPPFGIGCSDYLAYDPEFHWQ